MSAADAAALGDSLLTIAEDFGEASRGTSRLLGRAATLEALDGLARGFTTLVVALRETVWFLAGEEKAEFIVAAKGSGRLQRQPTERMQIIERVLELADELCEGQVVSILEGGYGADCDEEGFGRFKIERRRSPAPASGPKPDFKGCLEAHLRALTS